MAVITPTLSLTANAHTVSSNPGPMSMALALTVSDSLTVDLVEQQLYTIGTGANTVLVDGSEEESAFTPGTNGCFIYVKNAMTTGTETICIGIVNQGTGAPAVDDGTDDLTRAHADSHRTFALKAGEFAFFPFDYCGDIYAQATAAAQTLEFWRFDRG